MIRFGIIGAGFIANQFARDIQFVPGATLTAIASRDVEKAKEFQTKYQLKHAFGDYASMIESDVIDAVYIATPHNLHAEQAVLCLQHHKHVLIEKAITANTAQLNQILQIAKDKQRTVMEAMWTRFLPSSQYVKDIVMKQTYGPVQSMEFEFGYSLIQDNNIEGRLLNPSLAGGSILDIGVYPISFMQFLHPAPIQSISSKGDLHQTGVDIRAEIEVTFTDGVVATLKSSIADHYHKNGRIVCQDGVIEMVDFSRSKQVIINGVSKEFPMIGEGFCYQIKEFVSLIEQQQKESRIMSLSDSYEVMKMMDQIRKDIGVVYPFET